MHDTLLEGIKFNLDHFDRYQDTYFLAGWVHSDREEIEVLRVESLQQFHSELTRFEVRHDVNKFYDLPEQTVTGFKFILTPDTEFSSLLFSVKLRGQDRYQVIREVDNPRHDRDLSEPEPETPQPPRIKINNPFPGMVVVENFYSDPDQVRHYALAQEFKTNLKYHKGHAPSAGPFSRAPRSSLRGFCIKKSPTGKIISTTACSSTVWLKIPWFITPITSVMPPWFS
ncbi:MAG: hypothetical protein R3E89_05930 [Thiolinea sp.]